MLITDLHYFSPVIFFYTLDSFSDCIFEQYESWQKRGFRNRCTVLGGNGPVQLSIPLAGGRGQKTLMKDVRIDGGIPWRDRHWKTILSCYNRSPWFDHYRDGLEAVYRRKREFLLDWNLECFYWVTDKLSIKTRVTLSREYIADYGKAAGYADHRDRLRPATIASVDPAYSPYTQVFSDRFGFIPNLSILDRLFCAGPEL